MASCAATPGGCRSPTRSFDACISQEALLHIADKSAVLAGCRRVLRPGGRLAFSDWIAHPRLADRERERLRDWMAATTLQTLDSYRAPAGARGLCVGRGGGPHRGVGARSCAIGSRCYRGLRDDTVARLGEARYRDYDQLYAFFVAPDRGRQAGGRPLLGGALIRRAASESAGRFRRSRSSPLVSPRARLRRRPPEVRARTPSP